jgi:hypothetical protein
MKLTRRPIGSWLVTTEISGDAHKIPSQAQERLRVGVFSFFIVACLFVTVRWMSVLI